MSEYQNIKNNCKQTEIPVPVEYSRACALLQSKRTRHFRGLCCPALYPSRFFGSPSRRQGGRRHKRSGYLERAVAHSQQLSLSTPDRTFNGSCTTPVIPHSDRYADN